MLRKCRGDTRRTPRARRPCGERISYSLVYRKPGRMVRVYVWQSGRTPSIWAKPRRPYPRPLSAQRGRRIGCYSSAAHLDAFLGKGLAGETSWEKVSRFQSFKVSKKKSAH